MGPYRLILAYFVVCSHVIDNVFGRNCGRVAVASFFLLSGYVITALVQKHYLSASKTLSFYVDRFFRLGPQFYFYIFLTFISAALFSVRHIYMDNVPSLPSLLAQMTLFPISFYWLFQDMLLPQAGSLALEAIFYLLFPFILIFRLRMSVAIPSLAIFIAACTGLINPDWFGYRLLPGTLFIFIAGSWLYSAETPLEKYFPWALWTAVGAVLLLSAWHAPLGALHNHSVLVGLAIGIPAVHLLGRFGSVSKTFALAGDLSFGVFLNHYLVIGAFAAFTPIDALQLSGLSQWGAVLLICVASTGLSYTSFTLVERPLNAWRRRMRDRAGSRKTEPRLLSAALSGQAQLSVPATAGGEWRSAN